VGSADEQPRIRTIETADELEPLSRLDNEVFRDIAYPAFVLRQLYDLHHRDILVLEQFGRLIGYSLAVKSCDDGVAWVLALGVEPAARSRGYGRQLAEESFKLLRKQGVTEIRLSVEPDNDIAIALYTSMGFHGQEIHSNYLGRGHDRRLMTLSLSPGPAATPDGERHAYQYEAASTH
jgi:[ribosomal protein S18]-alanine N-acetyltransferase